MRGYWKDWANAWNQFWFTPRRATTLGLIRVLSGSMLFYTHLVWATAGSVFFGSKSVIPTNYRDRLLQSPDWAWSHFDWLPDDSWLIPIHIFALLVFLSFTVGFATRITGWLSWMFVVSYANRTMGAQFGLDQVNVFMALYLAIAHSGNAFSVDAWLRRRKAKSAASPDATVANNVATRLIQIHLCVVYLFAAIGKADGEAWINGDAIMMAFSSYEYQTANLVWLVNYMSLVQLATLITLAWEFGYPALVWFRLTRPVMIGLAIAVHLGIGLTMGMLTFGLAMIYANMAFLEPETLERWLGRRKANSEG